MIGEEEKHRESWAAEGEAREIRSGRTSYEVDRSARERGRWSKKATTEIERETRKRRRKAVVSMFSSSWIVEGV